MGWPACAAASWSVSSPTRRSSSTSSSNGSPIAVKGWLYGNRHQFFIQLFAALTIIVYDALMTFIILKVIRIFTPLRMPDDELEVGDLAVHDEEAYPADEGYTRVDAVAVRRCPRGAAAPAVTSGVATRATPSWRQVNPDDARDRRHQALPARRRQGGPRERPAPPA